MERCKYCQYRNWWACEDGWNTKPYNVLCDDFKLDFDTLPYKQKIMIQKIFMSQEDVNSWE